MICYFGKLNEFVQTSLLYTYCSSFYGSVLWDLENKLINRVCSAWCGAIRRIWKLPFSTHRNILYSLCGKWSVYDELCRRNICFALSCLECGSDTVTNVVNSILLGERALSPFGRNLLHVCDRYNLRFDYFTEDRSYFSHTLLNFRGLCENNFPPAQLQLLFELLMLRNRVFHTNGTLTDSEINDMIDFICTS